MAADGALASTLGALIGVGTGRGAALLIALVGVLLIITAAAGKLYAPLQGVDARDRAHDHDLAAADDATRP
jgi:hypothetical protein